MHRLKQQPVATIVGIKNGSWKWGQRCEVRVHAPDVDPKGHGYRDRCDEVHTDMDGRHRGPRSAMGQLLASLAADGVDVS